MTAAVFKFVFDESGDERATDHFYTLSGVVATRGKWKSFYKDWRLALQDGKPISYFKMHEAVTLTEQFSRSRGWTEKLANEKVQSLTDVLRTHASAHVVDIVPMWVWHRLMRTTPLDVKWENPYLMCFSYSLICVGYYMSTLKGPQRKPLLVYDEQKPYVMKFCNDMNEHLKSSSENEKRATGKWLSTIRWQEDKKQEIGIQAADLIAWHYRALPYERKFHPKRRRKFETQITGLPLISPPNSETFDRIERWRQDIEDHIRPIELAEQYAREANQLAKKAAWLRRQAPTT